LGIEELLVPAIQGNIGVKELPVLGTSNPLKRISKFLERMGSVMSV
jgi:hypothetical protein